MNRIISATAIQRGLWMGAILLSAVSASADTQVTFQVDMTEQVKGGTFVPGSNTVSAHGTFNGWGSGVNLTNNVAAANTNLYTGTVDDTSDANGAVLIFKYVIDSSYENTLDGDNRCAQLPAGGGSLLLPAAFYADAGPSSTANVTFQVDMAEQIYRGLFKTNSSVEVHGSFNGWGSGSTLTNDPTIRTTNAIGIVTSDVYVGTFAVTGSTNGAEEFKYVIQPGTSYEGPSASDSDYDNGNNRFFSISTQTLPIVSYSDQGLSYPLVTFQVDMTEQVTGGTFTPGTDTVSAHGTFNGWGAGLNLTNNPAATNPNLYSGATYDTADAVGAVLIYKFVTNGSSYEATTDGQNRCAQLPAGGGNLVLPVPFYADAGPSSSANVTFQVDMAEQTHVGNFDTNAGATVEVRGFFNGWGGGSTLTNDPTITTTNATGVVTSNVYVGTIAITGSTNGTEEYKYVMQPGTAYEGPLAIDSDYDNSNNRFFSISTQTLPIVSFSDKPLLFNTVTNNVTFEIDMTTQIEVGAFTGANTVEIHGDFNAWGGGQTLTNDPASTTPNIYSTLITYTDSAAAEHYFKYVIQPGTQWETVSAANASGGNRYLYLLQTNGSFVNGPVYYSDEAPSSLIDFVTDTNCMVTFTVNMTNAVGTDNTAFDNAYPSSDQIFINGLNNGDNNTFWGWAAPPFGGGPAAYQMTQITNTLLFTITLPVAEGQNEDLIYKYSINGFDNEAGFSDNHQRWIRSLPNYTMPVDKFGSQGTNTVMEPSFGNLGIASAASNQVAVTWLGRRGVHLQTAPSLNRGTVWTDLYLTDGTNLLVAPGGLAGTNYGIGQGNLFYRLVGPQ